jgi:hypothetical protein
MAVGDIVSAVSAPSFDSTFQPAAGVEIMITVGEADAINKVKLRDSSNIATGPASINQYSMKLFITNSVYLHIDGTGGQSTAYAGIQIK